MGGWGADEEEGVGFLALTPASPSQRVMGFLDESGDPAQTPFSSSYLVVALLATIDARAIALLVRRARHAVGGRMPSGELKASHSSGKVIERFLGALADENIALYVAAVDKSTRRSIEGEELYGQIVATVVRRCVERTRRLDLIIDKRYTNHAQQLALETTIREAIAEIPGHIVLIDQGDSAARPELQAVDFVAWAFGQKYERDNDRYARMLTKRVIVEDLLK